MCVAIELDTGIASLCARAQGDPNRPYPTFALALTLFDEPAWDALSPEHPLRYWRLIEINQAGGQPLTASPLRADERIVNCVKGLNYLDDRLSPLLSPRRTTPVVMLPCLRRTRARVETIVNHLKQTLAGQDLPVIQLLGTDSPSKQIVAAHAAEHARPPSLPIARHAASISAGRPRDLDPIVGTGMPSVADGTLRRHGGLGA